MHIRWSRRDLLIYFNAGRLPKSQTILLLLHIRCNAAVNTCVRAIPQAWAWKHADSDDPRRCYLKGSTRHAPRKDKQLTAGYPNGIAPPSSDHSWYNTTVEVELSFLGLNASHTPRTAMIKTINSTCANPKRTWVNDMGSVTWPTKHQLDRLRAQSQVCEETVDVSGDAVAVRLEAYAMVEIVLQI